MPAQASHTFRAEGSTHTHTHAQTNRGASRQAREDIVRQIRENRALRAGGWPCPRCLVINEATAARCHMCNDERDPHMVLAR